MFEKEKMLAGELYNANYDEELIKERMNVKDKCFEYNNIKPSNIEDRRKLMKEILGKYKDNFFIEQPFMCDYGYNIEIGENFYSNHNLSLRLKLVIGDVFYEEKGIYDNWNFTYYLYCICNYRLY